jgi:Nuclease-related domain
MERGCRLDVMADSVGVQGAGNSARQRYRRGLKSWRRSPTVKRVRLIVWPLISASILLAPWLPSPWAWTDGFVAGALAGLWLWLRDDPPEYIARWQRGAEGERETARALLELPAGWHVRHDVDAGYGNRDHVVVGPAGVFLLDSKNLGGTVTLLGSSLVVERRLDADASYQVQIERSLRAQAAGVSAELALSSGLKPWVQPVAVIWGAFSQRAVEHDGVAYVHGDELTTWLRDRPVRLAPEETATLVTAVEAMPSACWKVDAPAL